MILIIDDDLGMRLLCGEVLRHAGYETHECADGQIALDWLESSGCVPDVILLDLRMPRCNGAEFRAAQLARPAIAAVPVILMSGETECTLRGVRHLLKPIALEDILEAVTAAVAGKSAA